MPVPFFLCLKEEPSPAAKAERNPLERYSVTDPVRATNYFSLANAALRTVRATFLSSASAPSHTFTSGHYDLHPVSEQLSSRSEFSENRPVYTRTDQDPR